MRLNQLIEMTIRFGKVEPSVSASLLADLESGIKLGKIDGYDVTQKKLKKDMIGLGLLKNDKAIAGLAYKDGDPVVLYFITSLERDNGHASRLLWFLKDNLKKSIIDYGALSDDGLKFMSALSKTMRFRVEWYNIKTHEREPFDQEQEKMAYDKQTDWRALIEGSEISLDDPMGIITLFEAPNP
jgi:hypothetical protein